MLGLKSSLFLESNTLIYNLELDLYCLYLQISKFSLHMVGHCLFVEKILSQVKPRCLLSFKHDILRIIHSWIETSVPEITTYYANKEKSSDN